LSFSVITFHHPYGLALLPDGYEPGMFQEYDPYESPYQITPRVFTKSRHLLQGSRSRFEAGPYMGLVAIQIKPALQFHYRRYGNAATQVIQRINQARNRVQVRGPQAQRPGTAVGQHFLNTLSQIFLSLPGLGHLLFEITGIKDDPI
jgi:hypothetical protein